MCLWACCLLVLIFKCLAFGRRHCVLSLVIYVCGVFLEARDVIVFV